MSLAETHPATPRRSIRGQFIDVIRDGVPVDQLKRLGQGRIYAALIRTAMAAAQAGWTYGDWFAELRREVSLLGRQLRMNPGNQRDREPRHWLRDLNRAWARALEVIAERPADDRRHYGDAIDITEQFLGDYAELLPEAAEDVLRASTDQATRYETDTPVMPRRELAEQLGRTEREIRAALDWLDREGLLKLRHRGMFGGRPGKRRASIYDMPTDDGIERFLSRHDVHAAHIPSSWGGSMGGEVSSGPESVLLELAGIAFPDLSGLSGHTAHTIDDYGLPAVS
jgi:hypothetical protein